jgi:hypothetical protein
MRLTQAPEVNESLCRMRAEVYTEGEEVSTAEETARLCRENRREAGVKSYKKYKKREDNSSMTRRYYHLDQGQVDFANLRMKTNAFGDHKKKKSISHFYNFRSDPKLGLRRVAGRRIPCVCQS